MRLPTIRLQGVIAALLSSLTRACPSACAPPPLTKLSDGATAHTGTPIRRATGLAGSSVGGQSEWLVGCV